MSVGHKQSAKNINAATVPKDDSSCADEESERGATRHCIHEDGFGTGAGSAIATK